MFVGVGETAMSLVVCGSGVAATGIFCGIGCDVEAVMRVVVEAIVEDEVCVV